MTQNEYMHIEEEMDKVENNEDCTLCKECSLRCCENMGCEIFPIDIVKRYGGISVDIIEKVISTGVVSLDWWDGDPRDGMHEISRGFYLRMRNRDAPICDPCFSGVCALYNEKAGCPLSFENRPLGARIFVPKPNHKCDYGQFKDAIKSKKDIALHWLPYHSILDIIYKRHIDEQLVVNMEPPDWLVKMFCQALERLGINF